MASSSYSSSSWSSDFGRPILEAVLVRAAAATTAGRSRHACDATISTGGVTPKSSYGSRVRGGGGSKVARRRHGTDGERQPPAPAGTVHPRRRATTSSSAMDTRWESLTCRPGEVRGAVMSLSPSRSLQRRASQKKERNGSIGFL